MVWEPFALAVLFGLLISAGIYFVVMWPQVAPDDDAPDDVAVVPAPAAAAIAVEPTETAPIEAAPPPAEPPAEPSTSS